MCRDLKLGCSSQLGSLSAISWGIPSIFSTVDTIFIEIKIKVKKSIIVA